MQNDKVDAERVLLYNSLDRVAQPAVIRASSCLVVNCQKMSARVCRCARWTAVINHSGYSGVSYGNVATSVGNRYAQVTVRGRYMSDAWRGQSQLTASGVTYAQAAVHVLLGYCQQDTSSGCYLPELRWLLRTRWNR